MSPLECLVIVNRRIHDLNVLISRTMFQFNKDPVSQTLFQYDSNRKVVLTESSGSIFRPPGEFFKPAACTDSKTKKRKK